jgi:hypothetical protein
MDAAKIVIRMIDGDHMAMVFEFLGECVRESREAPYPHPKIQVLPFNLTGRDVIAVRIATQDARAWKIRVTHYR